MPTSGAHSIQIGPTIEEEHSGPGCRECIEYINRRSSGSEREAGLDVERLVQVLLLFAEAVSRGQMAPEWYTTPEKTAVVIAAAYRSAVPPSLE